MTLATLAARNLTRNKTRVALTILGVFVIVLAFMVLRTLLGAFTAQAEFSATDRIATRDKVSFINPLPMNYVEKVKNTPGVKATTWANWFGGQDPRDKKNFFATFAVDAKTYLDVYPELTVSPEARQRFIQDRQGALVGELLAKRLKVKEGDEVALVSPIFPGDWKFHVSGIYGSTSKGVDRSSVAFHWDYLNDGIKSAAYKDKVGWIISRIDDPLHAADISKRVDAVFDVMDTQTTTMSEKAMATSFGGMFSAILSVVNVVSWVILGVMLLILANTIAMGVRERTHEYGTLLALGFEPAHIGRLIVLESAFVGLVGGVIGAILGALMIAGAAAGLSETPMAGLAEFFLLKPVVAFAAVGIAVGLGVIAAAVPAWRASRLNVTTALRVVG